MTFERRCTLWVHDEGFSEEQVVINIVSFEGILPGDLMAISPLNIDPGHRDIPVKVSASKLPYDLRPSKKQSTNSNFKSPARADKFNQENDSDLGNRCLFVAKICPRAATPGLEISVSRHVATIFGLKHRSIVLIIKADAKINSASHVELSFKDEYLAQSDMWRLTLSELSCKTVYKGQKILFLGSVKAQVNAIHLKGRSVRSAFYSSSTVPIFRSGSARYLLFIQMSREMWDFDSEGSGEIMFNKVINGFLPTIFKKWAALKFEHLVSIVLFTRVEYETGITHGLAADAHGDAYYTGIQSGGSKRPYKDFYRVVVCETPSGSWTMILDQLKREFKFFRRDISMHHIKVINPESDINIEKNVNGVLGSHVEAQPSLAMYGNLLEAINTACCRSTFHHIDQDLMRTGNSIVIITPCAGLFEVEYSILKMTTEMLASYGIEIDLVCLPRMPLHSAPLFRYQNPEQVSFIKNLLMKPLCSEESTPQGPGVLTDSFSKLGDSPSPAKPSEPHHNSQIVSPTANKLPDKWIYIMPHWLNVSFWTGPSHNANPPRFSGQLRTERLGGLIPYRPTDFPVRCKMYEMEMAGIMESFLTEISVAPIQQESLFSQIRSGTTRYESSSIIRRIPFNGLSELNNRPSETLLTKKTSLEDNIFPEKVYDTYDLLKSIISEERPSLRQKNAKRTHLRYEGCGSPRNNLLDSGSLGTSTDKRTILIRKKTASSRQSPRKTKPRNTCSRGPSDARPEKTRTSNSIAAGTIVLDSRPFRSKYSKTSHRISLGKHGFGVAAPTTAAAEIYTENANAIKQRSISFSSKGKRNKSRASIVSNSLLPISSSSSSMKHPFCEERVSKDQFPHNTSSKDNLDCWTKDKSVSVKPLTVKSALESLDSTNQVKSRSVLDLFYDWSDQKSEYEFTGGLHSNLTDSSQKIFGSKLTPRSVPRPPIIFSPPTSLSPWLTILNPSSSIIENVKFPAHYRRCQPVMANSNLVKTRKWKSLCSPTSIPLTTENFPTKYQLDTEYQQKPYNISLNLDEEFGNEIPRGREELVRELVGLRLSQGFQIVVGPLVAQAFGQKAIKVANIFELNRIAEDGVSIFMSMGSVIHQLSCVNDGELEINIFVRKPSVSITRNQGLTYHPAIRTKLSGNYESRPVFLGKTKEHCNWNYIDTFIGGFYEEVSNNPSFYNARFVLIPVERLSQTHKTPGEDNEEEVRLEGIKKLTQIWQRYKVTAASERRTHNSSSNPTKDPNPLDIVYKTEDPSIVVSAELEILPLLEAGENINRKNQLFRIERFRKSNVDLAALVEAIQAPVEKGGVRMQNRRWHLRLHYNCFIGSDMTTWLIDNFENIETREKAVEFGNKLMIKDETLKAKEKESCKEREKDYGIFVHVEGRHMFRDGQYFYQLAGEFARNGPENRSGWFASKKRDPSFSSTPLGDHTSKDILRSERSRSSSIHEEISSNSGAPTPTILGGMRRHRVVLSKVMRYDVDHRKRSYHPEIINLHYDRLHNPDNCYHIRIDWLGVTAKLIQDTIESWTITADRYGLRLVEVPIAEACTVNSVDPFRRPYRVEILVPPPDQQPMTYMNVNYFLPQLQLASSSRHYYLKALLKKFNFVLDTEAATNFPSNVDVSYSWGKPNYHFSQYIHQSGVLLAQITDDGGILLLTNSLYNNRTIASREDSLSYSRLIDSSTPEAIKNELERFCGNAECLQTFYREVSERSTLSVAASPQNQKNAYMGNQTEFILSSPQQLSSSVAGDMGSISSQLDEDNSNHEIPAQSTCKYTHEISDSIERAYKNFV